MLHMQEEEEYWTDFYSFSGDLGLLVSVSHYACNTAGFHEISKTIDQLASLVYGEGRGKNKGDMVCTIEEDEHDQ